MAISSPSIANSDIAGPPIQSHEVVIEGIPKGVGIRDLYRVFNEPSNAKIDAPEHEIVASPFNENRPRHYLVDRDKEGEVYTPVIHTGAKGWIIPDASLARFSRLYFENPIEWRDNAQALIFGISNFSTGDDGGEKFVSENSHILSISEIDGGELFETAGFCRKVYSRDRLGKLELVRSTMINSNFTSFRVDLRITRLDDNEFVRGVEGWELIKAANPGQRYWVTREYREDRHGNLQQTGSLKFHSGGAISLRGLSPNAPDLGQFITDRFLQEDLKEVVSGVGLRISSRDLNKLGGEFRRPPNLLLG